MWFEIFFQVSSSSPENTWFLEHHWIWLTEPVYSIILRGYNLGFRKGCQIWEITDGKTHEPLEEDKHNSELPKFPGMLIQQCTKTDDNRWYRNVTIWLYSPGHWQAPYLQQMQVLWEQDTETTKDLEKRVEEGEIDYLSFAST